MKFNKETPATKEQRRQYFRDNLKVYIDSPPRPIGGQSAGMPTFPTVIESEYLSIKISIGSERSNYKNKKIALEVFDLILLEIIN